MQNRPEIISYQKLRAFIGFTGILLPVAVVGGCFVLGSSSYSWQHSISHYYYSIMHVIFVGVLCVLGGFLISYQGKDVWESRLSNLAGCFAFGVASFPTRFDGFRVGEGNTYHQYLQVFPDVSNHSAICISLLQEDSSCALQFFVCTSFRSQMRSIRGLSLKNFIEESYFIKFVGGLLSLVS